MPRGPDDEDDQDHKPEPEDFVKTPCGQIGENICVGRVEGKYVGQFFTHEKADEAICEVMIREEFWPTVWWLDDHGGVEPDSRFSCHKGRRSRIEERMARVAVKQGRFDRGPRRGDIELA